MCTLPAPYHRVLVHIHKVLRTLTLGSQFTYSCMTIGLFQLLICIQPCIYIFSSTLSH